MASDGTHSGPRQGGAPRRNGGRPGRGRDNRQQSGGRPVPGLAVRRTALDSLTRILDDGQALDTLIDGDAWRALAANDRALARAIVSTTLRHLGEIDHALAQAMEKPLGPKGRRALRLLQLGAAQVLFLETADHAAVSTAVEVAAADRRLAAYKALINAVLRRLIRERDTVLQGIDSARLNTPDWLIESWSAAYGEEVARQIAAANGTEAALDLSAQDDPQRLAEQVGGVLLPTGTVRIVRHHGPVTDLPGFDDGLWWVQDAAAALPARLLGDVSGLHVADYCAAPGGKTAQLAAGGARVTAIDIAESRLDRLRTNLERLSLQERVDTIACDVLEFEPDEPFDAILLDAPCSATGTIRRHPDVPFLKTPKDVAALCELQDALLDKAVSCLAPGGTLIYCTCSLQAEEGAERIDALLRRRDDIERRPIAESELPALPDALTPAGDLRTLPHYGFGEGLEGVDGFFAARLKRI